MRRLILLAALFAPATAWAQAPQAPPPEMQALQSVAMEAIQARLNWQTQAIALQAQVVELQKQLAAAQAKSQEPRP